MKKKVVAAMLAACMAVSLTACGNSDSVPRRIQLRQKSASTMKDKTDSEETKEGRNQDCFCKRCF